VRFLDGNPLTVRFELGQRDAVEEVNWEFELAENFKLCHLAAQTVHARTPCVAA